VTLEDVRSVVDYHYWARDRLLEACAPLTSDQFTRDLSSRPVQQLPVGSGHASTPLWRRLGLASPVAGSVPDRFPCG
jgi:hypothetical protein